MTSIELLTNLQEELGYVKGDISTVAMLGLVGEAGEVLAETLVTVGGNEVYDITQPILFKACKSAAETDALKKRLRKKEIDFYLTISEQNQAGFDAELADTFYYLNILATNRGLTIFDLAQMGHDKVRAKQAAGGSSEDKK